MSTPRRWAQLLHQFHPLGTRPDSSSPRWRSSRSRRCRGALLLGLADPFWRAPRVVIMTAMLVRRALENHPPSEMKKSESRRVPALAVFVHHYWRSFRLRIVVCHLYGFHISTTVTVFFGLAYAVEQWDIPAVTSMLWTIVISNIGQVISIPLWAMLSDRDRAAARLSPRGALGCAASVFVYFLGHHHGRLVPRRAGLGAAGLGLLRRARTVSGRPVLRMFDARVRYTGMAVSAVRQSGAGFPATVPRS
ncbi:MHS family MFS transporter [Pseudonocardia sp. MCCB 268]|nr:MHS family MFS transporter [Pseudonocardia cytotoxica]